MKLNKFLVAHRSYYEKRIDSKGNILSNECIDDEIPFDIPESWEWARGDIVYQLLNGLKLQGSKYIKMDAFYLRGKSEGLTVDSGQYVSKNTHIILVDGENSGEVFVTPHEGYMGSTFKKLWISARVSPNYVNLFMKLNQNLLRGNKRGAAIPHLDKIMFCNLLFPLPPLSEQQRIVEQVNKLTPLIDEYGVLEEAREKLDSELPDRLRKSLLQMAVEGKLVPQDSNDEPAGVLLERIRAERAKLLAEKKIKFPKGGESVIYRTSDGCHYEKRIDAKGNVLSDECIDDEIPFEIPDSWEWARLESISLYIQRGKSPKYSRIEKYPVVSQKCNQWSGFSLEKAKFLDPKTIGLYTEERILQNGDLLWNSTGLGTLGRMAIYDSSRNPYNWAVADSHVTVIRLFDSWLIYPFAFAYFSGPYVQSIIEDQASGSTKQKELSLDTVKRYLIPVPPLTEQYRIVEHLDKLISYLD